MEQQPIQHPLKIGDLPTPCLVLDLDLLEANIDAMQDSVNQAQKALRPHAKTHKCTAIAEKQIKAGAVGVCAAKLSEARILVENGFSNILITGPVAAPARVEELATLVRQCPSLMAVVDSRQAADHFSAVMTAAGLRLDVLLDLDVGLHRTGANILDAPDLSRYIADCKGLTLKGIQAYAGQVQHETAFEKRRAASLSALRPAARFFRWLAADCPGCTIFSASGTGTFDIDVEIEEVTELQAGSYVCMDAEYRGIEPAGRAGCFDTFGPALRLLTTVVSANHDKFVTIDAGLKAVYKDGGIPEVIAPQGLDLSYDWFGDEYGKISNANGGHLPGLGDQMILTASHCDPTINLHDRYYVVRGRQVQDVWPIDLRGCSQ